jgi:hypothetical protein
MLSDKQVQVDICQSSGGAESKGFVTGPQCNTFVTLTETSVSGPQNRKMFKISGGEPPLPVDGHVYIMEMKDLFY